MEPHSPTLHEDARSGDRSERRGFLLGALAVLAAGVLIARLHVLSVDRRYRVERIRGEPIDVNRADAATLSLLDGIGPERARAIVRWREIHGPFRSWKDLIRVEGIGPRTAERLVGWIRFGAR